MPGKKAFPKQGARANSMYEHIKQSELRAGRPLKKAKRIAAGRMYNTLKGRV